jgi:hypothetical protein
MDDKRCARCREVKPRSAFYRNAGLHAYCKPCLLAYQRDRRLDALDAADPGRRRWSKWSLEHDYFDGDGLATIANIYRDRVYGRWGLLGTRSFLEGALEFICSATSIRPRVIHGKKAVHYVHVNGADALVIDVWLHAGLPLGLERKRLSRMIAAASATCGSAS